MRLFSRIIFSLTSIALLNASFAYAWTNPNQNPPGGNGSVAVDASGNLGLGTANPGAKLEVNGQVKITGGSPGAGKVLTSDATGLGSWQTSSGALGGSGTTNYVSKFTNSSTLGNSLLYDDGTNIGIGITNPVGKLHVNGPGVFGYSAGTIDDINGHTLILRGRPDAQSLSSLGFQTNSANKFDLGFDGSVLAFWGYAGSWGEKMRINVGDGNIGIGMTPSQKLDVAGYVKGTGLCIGSDCRTSWPGGFSGFSVVYDTTGSYSGSGNYAIALNTYTYPFGDTRVLQPTITLSNTSGGSAQITGFGASCCGGGGQYPILTLQLNSLSVGTNIRIRLLQLQ